MAKKVRRAAPQRAGATETASQTPVDKKTLQAIRTLADGVVDTAQRRKAPHLDIPSRSLSNVHYNKSKRFIEMGTGKNRRELFNLSQAKSYMQTMLVGSGCKRLIEQGKTTSIRGLFYLL
ncbi:MAG: DNA topoisomerase VI, partial [Pirellulaceae bacterium]|nr:DNA topoisomerase VI [Pirellulaceae bacterium]